MMMLLLLTACMCQLAVDAHAEPQGPLGDPGPYLAPFPLRVIIQDAAAEFGIPIDIFIRLCYEESRFNANAVNRNVNGTTDYWWYQINSIHFQLNPTLDFHDMKTHVRFAAQYLKWCWIRGGTWERALWLWNAGRLKNVPDSTKHFARRVLDKEPPL